MNSPDALPSPVPAETASDRALRRASPQAASLTLPLHGGYRSLVSFRVAQLTYDVTVRFCERFVDRSSRTHDQMIQAARSGVQNIAEGSRTSGTSKATELKLTNVARSSLDELRLDFEDFLRHREGQLWPRHDVRRADLVGKRFGTAEDVFLWIEAQHRSSSEPIEQVAANAAHILVGTAISLLGRQVESQARALREGEDRTRWQRRR